jgi:general secretion pathway protein D
MNLRSMIRLALVVTLLAAPGLLPAQDAASDQATRMLEQGAELYQQLQFEQAKKVFLQVDSNALNQQQQNTLADYLTKVNSAITRQKAAIQAFNKAETAQRAGDLETARDLYRAAAQSEYLPEATRKDARAQLALVNQKLAIENGSGQETPATTVEPEPEPEPAPAVTVEDPVVVVTEPEEPVVVVEDDQPEQRPMATAGPKGPAVEVEGDEPQVVEVTPGRPVEPTKTPEQLETERLLAQAAADRRDAMQLVQQGNEALANDNYSLAEQKFEQALALAPNLAAAQEGKQKAAQQLAARGPDSILNRTLAERRVQRQRALVDFRQAMKESREALAEAQSPEGPDEQAFSEARTKAQAASNILALNQYLLDREQYGQLKTEVQEWLQYVDAQQRIARERSVAAQMEAVRRMQIDRDRRAMAKRERRIEELWSKAKALRDKKDYAEALAIVNQILQVDETSTTAQEWRIWLTQDVFLREEEELRREMVYQTQLHHLENARRMIPWYKIIKYPRPQEWKELTERREAYSATSIYATEEDREVKRLLQRKQPQLEFDGIGFEKVVRFLREVSGVSIHVNWAALEIAGIQRTSEVNVNLTSVTLEKALEVILSDLSASTGGLASLDYIIDDGVVTISTKQKLSEPEWRSTEVYDIRDMIMPIRDFDSPDLNLGQIDDVDDGGGTGTGGGGDDGGIFGGDDDDDDDDGDNNDDQVTRQELINNIMNLIETTIDPNSWPPAGGTIGSMEEHNGQLVITQTRKNHEEIQQLLNKLREINTLQVSVEARFVTVSTGFLNDIGIDLDFFFNIGSGLGGAPTSSVTDPWTGAQVPVSGTSAWGSGKPGGNNLTPLPVQMGTRDFTSMIGTSTSVPQSVGGQITNPGLSVSGVFLDDIQVNFVLNATKAHASTRSLTAPKLTLFNGQRAYVAVGTLQAYVSALEPVVEENIAAFTPTVSFVTTGSTLEVMATVSADRRYVTMELSPQITTLNGFTKYFINVGDVDEQGNPLTGSGFIQLPNVTLQRVETTVNVPDGGTLLLGGQSLVGEVEREMGVPILSSLPAVNRLFTNRGMVRDEQTLLIMVKPKILIQKEQEELQNP